MMLGSMVLGGLSAAKKKSKDWRVVFVNNTPCEVDVTIHRSDGPDEYDVIGSHIRQKIAFPKGFVSGITIGSQEEGLGLYYEYGSIQKTITIELDQSVPRNVGSLDRSLLFITRAA